MSKNVFITFGIIVLNGEPFIRYNLRALYPYAHEILVVEGACRAAANIATSNGHSRDNTLEVIKQFQAKEDPEHKITIITAEDEGYADGFWAEKTEMSQAYAKRATGNYLWQVDSDEFYLPKDMETIISILNDNPNIKVVSFRSLTFWGAINYVTDSFYLRSGLEEIHRIFAWNHSYTYVTHRPPTVHDAIGRDLISIKHMAAKETAQLGIVMYHYSLLLPKQVTEKCDYYSKAGWNSQGQGAVQWANECFFKLKHPFRVHSVYSSISWLNRFTKLHPPEVLAMISDIKSGKHKGITLRDNTDVEKLLSSRLYQIEKFILKITISPWKAYKRLDNNLRLIMIKTPIWPVLKWCKRKIIGARNG